MTTINMRRDGKTFVPDSIDLDPYSEYEHPTEPIPDVSRPVPPAPRVVRSQKSGIDDVHQQIDQFFDGVDMVFDLFNHVGRRINGGSNVRRGKGHQ